ncbi:MAG: SRPBCC family protein [Burkholderiales bacterium]
MSGRSGNLLLVLFLAGPSLGHGASVSVEVARHDDSFDVAASAEIECDQSHAWQILTDYDRLAEFIPGMASSRVVSRSGNSVVIEQNGEASLLFFRMPVKVKLAIDEFPPDRVESRAIEGNFKEMLGTYVLDSSGPRLRLYYSGRLTPDFNVPHLIGTLLMRNTIRKQFGAMVEEILKTSVAPTQPYR